MLVVSFALDRKTSSSGIRIKYANIPTPSQYACTRLICPPTLTFSHVHCQLSSAAFGKFCVKISKTISERTHFQQIEFPICAVLRPAELGLDTLARQAFRLLSKGRTARLLPGFGFHKSKTFEVNAWHILKPSILLTFCPGY